MRAPPAGHPYIPRKITRKSSAQPKAWTTPARTCVDEYATELGLSGDCENEPEVKEDLCETFEDVWTSRTSGP